MPLREHRLTLPRLEQLLRNFQRLTIGLLGDLFLDRYLEIDPSLEEVSIETGLAAHQVVRVRNAAGALGTVMNNLAALGVGRLVPVTVIGEDGHGDDLLRAMHSMPIDCQHIVRSADRLTPTYTKPLVLATGAPPRELNRLDVRSRRPFSAAIQQEIEDHLKEAFPRCDGWIVLDQVPEAECGVVNRQTRALLEQLTQQNSSKTVLIDSRARLADFRVGILKGNRREFLSGAGLAEHTTDEGLVRAVRQCTQRTRNVAFCTVGEAGMLVGFPDDTVYRVSGIEVDGPLDIVGAGDAATSGIVASLLAGGTPLEAAAVGNLTASITIQQLGTTGVATPTQLVDRLRLAGPPAIFAVW